MDDKGKLIEVSMEFSIGIVEYYRWLSYVRKEFVMSKQILKSGTSIGANINEAHYAISKADFISKMQIALKETAETEYWLTLLEKTGYFDATRKVLKEQCNSIKRMLISTLRTAKNRVDK